MRAAAQGRADFLKKELRHLDEAMRTVHESGRPLAHRVLTGSGHDGRQLERHQARRVEIRAGTELPREVDGEVITPGRSLTVTLLRRALTVRVPPSGG